MPENVGRSVLASDGNLKIISVNTGHRSRASNMLSTSNLADQLHRKRRADGCR